MKNRKNKGELECFLHLSDDSNHSFPHFRRELYVIDACFEIDVLCCLEENVLKMYIFIHSENFLASQSLRSFQSATYTLSFVRRRDMFCFCSVFFPGIPISTHPLKCNISFNRTLSAIIYLFINVS